MSLSTEDIITVLEEKHGFDFSKETVEDAKKSAKQKKAHVKEEAEPEDSRAHKKDK